MKTLWAAMIGLSATVFAFEGDWSTWDRPEGDEGAKAEETRTYSHAASETGEEGIYGLRKLGRSESRWMGSLAGQSGPNPSAEGTEGMSRFDWTRKLGRAEAHHIEGSARNAYLGSDPASVARAAEGKELGCNLVEANRDLGRDEARAIDLEAGTSGEPPTTWEMEEDDERKAAAEAARDDC